MEMELHIIFKGKVQGVGFRWTVCAHGQQFHLKGYVENLKDGSVEVHARGKKESLESFLQAIKQDPGSARIDTCKIQYKPVTAQVLGEFSIR
jgi:acylphosphatase